jgi:predicted dehydrogenase
MRIARFEDEEASDLGTVRLAIVGCGAVTEKYHLPAASSLSGCEVTVLADKDLGRARRLAEVYGVAGATADYRDVIGKADAAIVALPHHLHAPVSRELLGAGCHVLVEKPMAVSSQECDEMIGVAASRHAVLAVGLMRRFWRSARHAKEVIASGCLGRITSFDFREGNIYNWPVASDFFFRRETAGGGVLFDTGAHTLDLLLWWLGDVDSFEYYDDNYGGVEADCEFRVTMSSDARGVVELSRTRELRNTAIIRGELGEVEVHLRGNELRVSPDCGGKGAAGRRAKRSFNDNQRFADLFLLQLEDWLAAIRKRAQPAVPGEEGRKSVALIEACYGRRQLLDLPWVRPGVNRWAERGAVLCRSLT